jgi:hypothetical protein
MLVRQAVQLRSPDAAIVVDAAVEAAAGAASGSEPVSDSASVSQPAS